MLIAAHFPESRPNMAEPRTYKRENAPAAIIERRDQYITLLTDIQSGNCVLVVASGVLASPDPEIFSTTSGFKPIFDSRDWIRQRIDPDLVERDKDLDT